MNERIKELAAKARDFATTKDAFGEYSIAFDNEKFEQKFAELIAKDCAQIAMSQHQSHSFASYDELDEYDRGCDDTASTISGQIRQRFGVS